MYAVSASRTMANARPKTIAQDNTTCVISMAGIRQRWAAEAEERHQQHQELQRKYDAEQKAIADRAIARANAALRVINGHPTSIEQITRRFCRALGVTRQEFFSHGRTANVVLARQAVMYWASRRMGLSLEEIGLRLGKKDHSTVYHGKAAYVEKRAKMGRTLRPAR